MASEWSFGVPGVERGGADCVWFHGGRADVPGFDARPRYAIGGHSFGGLVDRDVDPIRFTFGATPGCVLAVGGLDDDGVAARADAG